EGFGLVTIEAMALGKPVVAFDHGPGNEIVVDGKTGLLAKSGDVHDLAKKIIRVLEDRDLAESLGRAGRKRFLEKYQIEKCVREYETLLHPIL
ncbi:MAG: glycosyl transferase family 1, partial [Candidatus Pacebacteria bacterium CG_4_10_14_0_8_um_filter_42_14]